MATSAGSTSPEAAVAFSLDLFGFGAEMQKVGFGSAHPFAAFLSIVSKHSASWLNYCCGICHDGIR